MPKNVGRTRQPPDVGSDDAPGDGPADVRSEEDAGPEELGRVGPASSFASPVQEEATSTVARTRKAHG
jgi:hypothetical protein